MNEPIKEFIDKIYNEQFGIKQKKKYKVWVKLEQEYDDIEAESEEEAYEIASDLAMQGGDWEYTVKEISE